MSENAYEPLLSTDETEALLQAMRSGGGSNSQSAKEVELGSPDQRLRKTLGKADDVARDWAAEVRKVLRRMLGISASVRESHSDVVPYSVIAQSLLPGAAICCLRTSEGAPCFLVLGVGLTSFVINRRLGGAASKQEGVVEEPRSFLSAVDRRIVRPFCEEVNNTFAQRWAEGLSLSIADVLARPVDMPRLGQFEPMLRVSLNVSFGVDSSEEISIVLSGDAIRAQSPAEAALPDPVRPVDRTRMVARLALAELELVAVLGKANSTVRKVLSLNVGDVIRLEEAPTEPLQVYVEGQKKMVGAPVVSHGNVAVEILEVVKGVP